MSRARIRKNEVLHLRKLLDWLVPSATLRIFVAMILYELQLDAGAASKAIHHEFVRDAYKRVGMKVSIVIFRGRRSTLDVSCCVVCANRIVRAASRSENVQIVWQEWHFVTCAVETPLSMREAAVVVCRNAAVWGKLQK
eukprot:s1647_g5.t1